jgi:hypothetical protein
MWKRKQNVRWVPWYRAPGYNGDLTEAEKRQLDAFRSQPRHPAATSEDLPEEVQKYLGALELELYDAKQAAAATQALILSGIGAALLGLHYVNCLPVTAVAYPFDVLLLLLPWLFYHRRWKRTADEFLSSPESDSPNPTDEALRAEWEREFILRKRIAR